MRLGKLTRVLVATWNVNSLRARMDRVIPWVASVQPDVLLMQETKLDHDAFPAADFARYGYDSAHFGEGRWNGVAIASRVGLGEVEMGLASLAPTHPQEARCIGATCGGVRVYSVYVPNGREVDHEHYHFKLAFLDALRSELAVQISQAKSLLVGGDFNIAPSDADVWSLKAFANSTHVTKPEREALVAIESLGLADLFRSKNTAGEIFSWWDYRAGDFHKRRGLRIDLILGTEDLRRRCEWAVIDRNSRKGKSPSDHAPVLVEV